MIMTLPNIKGQIGNTKAEITDNNELYLNSASYKDIIWILTKLIWGVDHCQYCGMKFVNCNCTSIDHIYPQYLGGGVEVTNFLTVACKRCNGDKGDLTINQYLKVLEME